VVDEGTLTTLHTSSKADWFAGSSVVTLNEGSFEVRLRRVNGSSGDHTHPAATVGAEEAKDGASVLFCALV
jgi:hypothetical protein